MDTDFAIMGGLVFTFPVGSMDDAESSFPGMICATNNDVVSGNLTFNITFTVDSDVQLPGDANDMATVLIIDNEPGNKIRVCFKNN